MKTYNKSKLAAFLLLFSIILISNSSNPPNGRTGAPGDSTCASCHSGTNSSLDGEMSFDGLPATIDANTTYTITVTVDNPNGNGVRGGFQWVSLDESNNDAGTMDNEGNNSKVTLAGGRTYHEHQPAQNFNGSNESSYTVEWTAPSGPDGEEIKFWGAGVIGNGSGSSGDRVVFNTVTGILSASSTPPTATIISQNDVSCNGLDDGSATVQAMGGAPGYSYLWNDSQGQTTATASNLEAGDYTVTVTDTNNETATAMVTISEPTEIDITVVLNTPEMCGNMDGYLEVSGSGGAGNYSYDWSNNGTGNFQSNLDSGTYTVTVTDDNNCTASMMLTVTIDNGTAGAIPTIIINPSCAGSANGYIEVMGTNGVAPYTFLWNTGATGPIVNSLTAGVYAVTATDANNCMGINVFTLVDPAGFTISTDSTDVVCAGDNNGVASVSVAGGSGMFTYLWSNGAATDTITNLSGGTYFITVTDENDCERIDSIIVNEPNMLMANLSATEETAGMMNGSATANPSGGTPGYSVAWSNGAMGLMIDNLSSGMYIATVTDTLGCTLIDSINVSSSDCGLSATFDAIDISCFGDSNGSIDLTSSNGSGTVSYNWSNGAMTEDISGLSSGIYSVTISDDLMCQVMIDSIEIIEPDSFSISPNIIIQPGCQGQNFGTISTINTGGTAPYSYSWAIGFTTDTINVLSGFYPVTVTDANNCTASTLINLNGDDNNPPNIVVGDFTLYLDNTGLTSTIDSTLFDLGSSDDCDLGPYLFDTTALDCSFLGMSEFPIALEDINGNIAYDTVTVTVIDTFPPDLFCLDDVTITECDGWTFDMPLSFDNCAASVTQTSGPVMGDILVLGNNVFTYESVDSSGNKSECSFTVTVESAFTVTPVPQDVSCFNFADGSVTFQTTGGNAPYDFIIGGVTNPNQLEAGNYFVTVTDNSGCIVQDSFVINEPPVLFISDANITNSTNSNSMDGAIDITVDGGTGSYTFEWFLNGMAISNDEDPSGLAPGIYTCVVTDQNDCVYTSLDYTVEATTSANEVAILSDLRVFPNPASEELNINLESSVFTIQRINVVSIDGKTVLTQNVSSNNNRMDISNIQSGVYLLQMILKDDIVYKKVIIE